MKELEEEMEGLGTVDRTSSVASKSDITLGREKHFKRQETNATDGKTKK